MRTGARTIALAAICLSLVGCNTLSGFLFYPDTRYYRTPDNLGIRYTPVSLPITQSGEDSIVLKNWLLHPKEDAQCTLLFLHGNAENISTHIGSVAWLTEHRVAVFLLDYRGYGQSTGESTLESAVEDITAAHTWLSQHRSDQPLGLFGQSLGGALAIYYQAHAPENLKPFEALATESAPASWPQISREVMARHWLTWLFQAPASLMTAKYDADEAIKLLDKRPLLLMHSKDDPVVPFEHYQTLKHNAPAHVQTLETDGKHIAALRLKENRERLLRFFAPICGD